MRRLRSTTRRLGTGGPVLGLLVFASAASFAADRADTPELVATGCGRGQAYSVDCSGGPRSSPFVCVRYTEQCRTDVQLEEDGPWYELLGVSGVSTEGIVASAKSNCDPGNWKKRLAEDLPAIMEGVCRPIEASGAVAPEATQEEPSSAEAESEGVTEDDAKRPSGASSGTKAAPVSQPPLTARVDLTLRDLESGKVVVRADVQADAEKRQLVQACWTKQDRCSIRGAEENEAKDGSGDHTNRPRGDGE